MKFKFSFLEIPSIVAIAVFTGAFLLLQGNDANPREFLSYYAKQAIGSSQTIFYWTVELLLIGISLHIAYLLLAFGLKGRPLKELLSSLVSSQFPLLWKWVKENLVSGILLLLGVIPFGLAIAQLNIFNTPNLKDELIAQWDFLVTGTYPFLSLGLLPYPGWFVEAVEFSFEYLAMAILALAAYAFLWRSGMFRQMVAAFFLGSIILFVAWSFLPAMSPHGRFIDNVYNLPISPFLQQELLKYSPHEKIANFQKEMREDLNDLSVLPTTTMPSAHVVWGVLLVYYSFRISRWLLLFTLPFALLSTVGTVLFAQHYFVDIPAGILVSLLSILAVEYLKKRD